jgi:hypothetical protein
MRGERDRVLGGRSGPLGCCGCRRVLHAYSRAAPALARGCGQSFGLVQLLRHPAASSNATPFLHDAKPAPAGD